MIPQHHQPQKSKKKQQQKQQKEQQQQTTNNNNNIRSKKKRNINNNNIFIKLLLLLFCPVSVVGIEQQWDKRKDGSERTVHRTVLQLKTHPNVTHSATLPPPSDLTKKLQFYSPAVRVIKNHTSKDRMCERERVSEWVREGIKKWIKYIKNVILWLNSKHMSVNRSGFTLMTICLWCCLDCIGTGN